MRLYLSSFRLGTSPEHLVDLVGEGGRVAVIANAIDGEPDATRDLWAGREAEALSRLGLDPVELDLRRFFDVDPGEVLAAMEPFDLLWVRGGNVFTLRAAMAASGADSAIRSLLRDDALAYAGYSAGPCVLAPDLAGLEKVDDAGAPQRVYGFPSPTSGLAVLDRPFVPHVDSPTHPESADLDRLSLRYAEAGVGHWRLRDGEALVVDGDTTLIVGQPATVGELLYDA